MAKKKQFTGKQTDPTILPPPLPFPVPETDPDLHVPDPEPSVPVLNHDDEPTPTPVTVRESLVGLTVSSRPPGTSRFTKGYLEDVPDTRDFVADALFGALVGIPKEYSLAQYIRMVRSQGATSSCVGHGLWAMIDIRQKVLGLQGGEPSPLGIYGLARTLGKLASSDRLSDDGCYPRLAMRAIREWGVPLEAKWAFDPKVVNDELPWDVLQQASGTKVTAWYRVDGIGQGRVNSLKTALSKGYPVGFGTEVDEAYEDWNGIGVIGPKGGKSLGGHFTCIVGYRTEKDGTTSFQFLNSWGKGWGQNGMGWLSEGRITALESRDFYVMVLGG